MSIDQTLKLKFAAYDCAYASFPWKINRYSYGVQFGINCTALDQSKLSDFVECTISHLMATSLTILVSNTQFSVALATSWWKFRTVLFLYIHINFNCVCSPSEMASGTSALQTPKCTNNAMEPMMLSVIQ